MCHKPYQGYRLNQQRGFLIPLAVFIIAGLSLLAISLTRLASQSGLSSFREGLSAQAFYAAESGVGYALNQVLFPSASRATADTACLGVDGTTLNFDVEGLNQCSAEIGCSSTINASDTVSYYSVESFASCGAGELITERVVQATAYLE